MALRLPRTAFKQKIRDLFFRIFDAEESYVPRGLAARSRFLSRFASLAQIGELAQAKYEPVVVSIGPEGTPTFYNRQQATGKRLLHEATLQVFLYWSLGTGSVLCRIALWDYWDAVTSFIGCCEVARETESNLCN